MQPDFMLYDENNNLLLVGEVKATKSQDQEWVAKLRRNLVAHGLLPTAPFFLLVSPEHIYLWKDVFSDEQIDPHFVSDTRSLLTPYLSRYGGDMAHLSESGLELAARAWLNDVISRTSRNGTSSTDDWFTQSGLATRARQGSLRFGDTP